MKRVYIRVRDAICKYPLFFFVSLLSRVYHKTFHLSFPISYNLSTGAVLSALSECCRYWGVFVFLSSVYNFFLMEDFVEGRLVRLKKMGVFTSYKSVSEEFEICRFREHLILDTVPECLQWSWSSETSKFRLENWENLDWGPRILLGTFQGSF